MRRSVGLNRPPDCSVSFGRLYPIPKVCPSLARLSSASRVPEPTNLGVRRSAKEQHVNFRFLPALSGLLLNYGQPGRWRSLRDLSVPIQLGIRRGIDYSSGDEFG